MLRSEGFQILRTSFRPAEEVPLPWSIRCLPHYWLRKPPAVLLEYDDSVKRLGLIRGETGPVECFIRYMDNRAVCVLIRAPRGQSALGTELQRTLKKAFPHLPVSVVDSAP